MDIAQWLDPDKRNAHIENVSYYSRHKTQERKRKIGKRPSGDALVNCNLKAKYNITLEEKKEMWREQNYMCAICRKHLATIGQANVDHDHATGEVRALLCRDCNTGLGHYRDSPDLLREAADYLERF